MQNLFVHKHDVIVFLYLLKVIVNILRPIVSKRYFYPLLKVAFGTKRLLKKIVWFILITTTVYYYYNFSNNN